MAMFKRKKDDELREGTFAHFQAKQSDSKEDGSPEGSSEIGVEPKESRNESTEVPRGHTDSSPQENGQINGGEGQVEESPGATTAAEESGELEKLKKKAEESYDRYVRTAADLENIRKRHAKERQELIKYAGEQLARDLLEVVDNLELALKQAGEGNEVKEDFVSGIRLIYSNFLSILERHSIRAERALGESFDPAKHEALASVPTSEHPAGYVIDELKRAYFFKDKLLRPAQVVVATAPPDERAVTAPGEFEKSEDREKSGEEN